MVNRLRDYIVNKYNLECELNIDLIIKSPNLDETIIATIVDDDLVIKYDDYQIVTNAKRMYKDISFLLDNLAFVYYLDSRNDVLGYSVFQNNNETTMIEEIEDYIWNNKKKMDIEKIMCVHFANNYTFEAKVSGSFVDLFTQVYDQIHYEVKTNIEKKFKYKGGNYLESNRVLMKEVFNTTANVRELKKYFLDMGYCFIVNKDDDGINVFQMIDLDFDTCKTISGDMFMIMNARYDSIMFVCDNHIYIRGKICDVYPEINKYIQIGDKTCHYIHSLKTSRVLVDGKIYEACGKTLSEEINLLNKLVGGNLMCCFTCKYGNYVENHNDIYCMHSFKPADFADVLYIIDETKMIPYDLFNLCGDYEIQEVGFYTHTRNKR